MISRRSFLVGPVAFVGGVSALSYARVAMASEPYWYVGKSGFAADGADVVAYFSLGVDAGGVAGQEAFQTEWNGTRWRFSSADNLATFKSAPEKFAPQYGGYCSYAVSQGYTAHGDINAWTIENGKLYLNFNKRVRRRWLKDVSGYIAAGDANWPRVLSA